MTVINYNATLENDVLNIIMGKEMVKVTISVVLNETLSNEDVESLRIIGANVIVPVK
jgi:hypothetical protein